MMPVQRTRVAESRVRNKSSNGPLRVQSNAQRAAQSILQRGAYVSCRGYDGTSLRARVRREIKVAPRIIVCIRP